MLLLRKVLSSIRIHLIYSAKTGSSQSSFTQFLDIADWQGERRWQSQHWTAPGPLRQSSALSDASKWYKSITDNSYSPFSCDEAPNPERPVYPHQCVTGTEPTTGCSAITPRLWHLLILPSSSQCLCYMKSWNFRGRMRWFLHPHRVKLLGDVQGAIRIYQIFIFDLAGLLRQQ